MLVEKGGADVQERNATTGWVALHEAAFRGHVDCVRVCLYKCVCDLSLHQDTSLSVENFLRHGWVVKSCVFL